MKSYSTHLTFLIVLLLALFVASAYSAEAKKTRVGIMKFEASKNIKAKEAFRRNSVGMEFVYIKPGSFVMGSPSGESGRDSDEYPHHMVTRAKHGSDPGPVEKGNGNRAVERKKIYKTGR